KFGIPGDADFVFDVRSLPNPYWEQSLRDLSGRDAQVVEYLNAHAGVRRMIDDLIAFLEPRMPEFMTANRSYLTIAIGCTGGRHRSVYIAECLAGHFRGKYPEVLTRHISLDRIQG
ncbi:MAG: RNase adaptor protein RapZ, partial [Proteobacteria bacterium]|nr:RNase adaptor protein RapZ [Pseudomonadota bacterium]